LKFAINGGPQDSAGKQWDNLSGKGLSDFDFFFQAAGAQDRPLDLKTLPHYIARIQFIASTCDGANQDHAAFQGQDFLAGFYVWAAYEIKGYIYSRSSCPLVDRGIDVVKVLAYHKSILYTILSGRINLVCSA